MLKLHEAMKTLFEEQGYECVKNVKLANMLTDLTSFKNMPAVKNAIEQLVKGGYGEKLYRLYQANNPSDLEIQKYKNDLSIKYGLNPAVVGYVFDCIAYGLGWRTDDVAIPDFSKSNQMDDELLKQKLAEQKAALLAQAEQKLADVKQQQEDPDIKNEFKAMNDFFASLGEMRTTNDNIQLKKDFIDSYVLPFHKDNLIKFINMAMPMTKNQGGWLGNTVTRFLYPVLLGGIIACISYPLLKDIPLDETISAGKFVAEVSPTIGMMCGMGMSMSSENNAMVNHNKLVPSWSAKVEQALSMARQEATTQEEMNRIRSLESEFEDIQEENKGFWKHF